jgi:hypothetical protein
VGLDSRLRGNDRDARPTPSKGSSERAQTPGSGAADESGLMGAYDDGHDSYDDDRDAPQESDLAADDDDAAPTARCPECGRALYEDAAWCPACRLWVVPTVAGSGPRRWPAVVLLIVFVVPLVILMWRWAVR